MHKEFETHKIINDKCKECDEWYFTTGELDKHGWYESEDIQFPIEHKKCGGNIHLFKAGYSDEYCTDINLIFQCDKCKKFLYTWTEGEYIDNEFEEIFKFHPIIKLEDTNNGKK